MQAVLKDIMNDRSRTVVIVSHRLASIRGCDQIVVLDAGRVAEVGSHDQLMAMKDGIYRSLSNRQNLEGDFADITASVDIGDFSQLAGADVHVAALSNGHGVTHAGVRSRDDEAAAGTEDVGIADV